MDALREAASVIDAVRERRGSVRNLCLNHRNVAIRRKLFALVSRVSERMPLLRQVCDEAGVSQAVDAHMRSFACVLAYELLFGKGIRGGGGLRKVVNERSDALRAALDALVRAAGVSSADELVALSGAAPSAGARSATDADAAAADGPADAELTPLWRFVRINHVVVRDDADVLGDLESQGWTRVPELPVHFPTPSDPSRRVYAMDRDVPHLIVSYPTAITYDAPVIASGRAAIQDKASCLPPFVLAPGADDVVVDACAAPGNKTSMLVALMCESGRQTGAPPLSSSTKRVVAFDRDSARCDVLRATLKRLGAIDLVDVVNADFSTRTPANCPILGRATMVLVDPSCSGSGIGGRDAASVTPARLAGLAALQTKLVLHALSLPRVRRVVYSTCSIFDEENERVVASVLEAARSAGRRVRLARALPSWPVRGRPVIADGDMCLRASRDETGTIGFFVALFVVE